MTTELQALSRIAVTEEAAGSFAVDVTGSATYLDIPFSEGSAQLTLTRTQFDPLPSQQYIDEYNTTVLGPRRWSLTFRMPLGTTGILADANTAAATATSNAQMALLKAMFGGLQGGQQGALVATQTSASVFVVTGGEGSQFTAGGAVGWVNSSSQLEVREIESVSTDTITTKVAFSGSPAVGNTIYNAATVYPTDDPATSLQFVVRGLEAEDQWLLMGGQGSVSFETPIGELPMATYTINGAHWLYVSEATSSTPWSTQAASYSNFQYVYGIGELVAQVVATATRQIAHVQEISYGVNLTYGEVTSPTGGGEAEAILRYRRMRSAPLCEVSFRQVYSSTAGDAPAGLDWFAARDSRATYHLAYQMGRSTTSGAVVLCTPTAQIYDAQRVDGGGLASSQITARSQLDDDATSQSTEIRRAAFRLHFVG